MTQTVAELTVGTRVKPIAGLKPQVGMVIVGLTDGVATCEYTRPRTKKARQVTFPVDQLAAFDRAAPGYLAIGKYAGR